MLLDAPQFASREGAAIFELIFRQPPTLGTMTPQPRMKSVSFKVTQQIGIEARLAACIAKQGSLFPNWDIVMVAPETGERCNAKNIMGMMMLAAERGTRVELFSLMPMNAWRTYVGSLRSTRCCYGGESNALEPIPRGGDPRLIAEGAPAATEGHGVEEQLPESLPQPMPATWSGDDLWIAWHLLSRHAYDVFIAAAPADVSYARDLFSFLEQNGIRTFLDDCSLAGESESDLPEVIELAMTVTRHMIVLGSREAFLKNQINAECPTYFDDKWAWGRAFDLCTVRVGDMPVEDLPSRFRDYQSFVWGSSVFSDVLSHVKSKRDHRRRGEGAVRPP